MSSTPDSTPSSTPVPDWPELSVRERRVLGVLVEKAKTTPDAYPLSINALVTACNQKSNRDPLLNLSDDEALDALAAIQKKHLAVKIVGGRVDRWRHALYEAWKVNKVELAVLGELLLRGPQTEGELRARANRMEPIEDLDALRPVLRGLAERRLVVYLTPEGRRGTTLTHGFHAPAELEHLRLHSSVEAAAPGIGDRPERTGPLEENDLLSRNLAEARADLDELRRTVARLETRVAELSEQVDGLKAALGG